MNQKAAKIQTRYIVFPKQLQLWNQKHKTCQQKIKPPLTVNQSCFERKKSSKRYHNNGEEKGILSNIFAETQKGDVEQQSMQKKRNLSCHLFQKAKQQVTNIYSKKDELQQLDQQKNTKQTRKHSCSYSYKSKKIDPLLLRSLQERLQNYLGLFKKLRKRSLARFETYSESESQIVQSQQINVAKLVLWTETKLNKTIKQFYIFVLNYSNNFDKVINKKLKLNSEKILLQIMKKYLLQKYKTQKLSRQNFLNLAYSLYNHLHKAQNQYSKKQCQIQPLLSRIRYLQIFDRILISQYDYEDILFYQYARWLLNQTIPINANQQFDLTLTEQEFNEYLIILTNNDSQLVRYYHRCFKSFISKNRTIDRECLLYFLLNDFKAKKEQIKFKMAKSKVQKQQLTLNVQKSTLQEVKKNNSHKYDIKFWPNQITPHDFQPQFYVIFKNELQKQCNRLVDIICNTLSNQCKSVILNLVTIKSLRLLHSISKGKVCLLQQLNYQFITDKSSASDTLKYFQQIQELQAKFMSILSHIREKRAFHDQVCELTKRILVCGLMISRLQELVQCFETV